MRGLIVAGLLAWPSLAGAQTVGDDPPSVLVSGRGSVSTSPDLAVIDFWIKGEGKTADEASAALASKSKAVMGGLASLLGPGTQATSGNVVVIEARSRECDDNRGYGGQPRISVGPCALVGYVATLQGQVRTAAVARAGTAAGLAARLGAADARVQGFEVSDKAAAQRRATAEALRDARGRAEAIAAGSGVRLGPVLMITDQNSGGGEIVVTGSRVAAPPAPPPPPPVEIDIDPRPIETSAQVTVRYSILR